MKLELNSQFKLKSRFTEALRISLCAALLSVACSACGPSLKKWEPETKQAEVWRVAYRSTPPAPVYTRARFVHLPEVLPARQPKSDKAPYIFPIVQLEFKNAKLSQIVASLAASAQYTNYCASDIASKKLSINSLGTLEELAGELAEMTNTVAIIDHKSRHLSFLESLPQESLEVEPRFLDSGERYEY